MSQRNFLLLAISWDKPYGSVPLSSTPIGPIIKDELYFVTRHSFPTVNKMNPFASLRPKFWINYCLSCIILIMSSIFIHLTTLNQLNLTRMIRLIISPSDSQWTKMVKSGVLYPCLVAFTFWSFNFLFGVDLAAALVGNINSTLSMYHNTDLMPNQDYLILMRNSNLVTRFCTSNRDLTINQDSLI